ncbi:SMC-Scp complex subunit ScpB, partial [Staphylococcus pettenkoferi]|uniref:SMC-Scp complex subunit ScpB n=1 Tax=Staphylococcus pettenkoferi TaxID=170573 RepID=UPI003B977637
MQQLLHQQSQINLSHPPIQPLSIIPYNQPFTPTHIQIIPPNNTHPPLNTFIPPPLLQPKSQPNSPTQQLYTTHLFLNVFRINHL